MDRHKIFYLALLTVAGLLTVKIVFQMSHQAVSPTVELVSKQDFVTAGDEIVASFRIRNPEKEPQKYTYALYLGDAKKFENTITIQPKRHFEFGGHFKALNPGRVIVTALVYEGNKARLFEDITYFVDVEPSGPA